MGAEHWENTLAFEEFQGRTKDWLIWVLTFVFSVQQGTGYLILKEHCFAKEGL